jgi:hypothetical protein
MEYPLPLIEQPFGFEIVFSQKIQGLEIKGFETWYLRTGLLRDPVAEINGNCVISFVEILRDIWKIKCQEFSTGDHSKYPECYLDIIYYNGITFEPRSKDIPFCGTWNGLDPRKGSRISLYLTRKCSTCSISKAPTVYALEKAEKHSGDVVVYSTDMLKSNTQDLSQISGIKLIDGGYQFDLKGKAASLEFQGFKFWYLSFSSDPENKDLIFAEIRGDGVVSFVEILRDIWKIKCSIMSKNTSKSIPKYYHTIEGINGIDMNDNEQIPFPGVWDGLEDGMIDHLYLFPMCKSCSSWFGSPKISVAHKPAYGMVTSGLVTIKK